MAVGILVVYPVVLSVYSETLNNNQSSWLVGLSNAYNTIFSSQNRQQLLIGILFGLLGVAFIMKIMVGKKKFQSLSAIQANIKMNQLIRRGENSYIAFQPGLWQPPLRRDMKQGKLNEIPELIIARIIAGLMNTHGGHLFIGINKRGKFLGLEEDYQILRKLSRQSLDQRPMWVWSDRASNREGFRQGILQVVAKLLDADCCTLVKIDFCNIQGKDICHIQVKQSGLPVYVHIGERAHFFIRSGKATRELDVREVLDYIENLLE